MGASKPKASGNEPRNHLAFVCAKKLPVARPPISIPEVGRVLIRGRRRACCAVEACAALRPMPSAQFTNHYFGQIGHHSKCGSRSRRQTAQYEARPVRVRSKKALFNWPLANFAGDLEIELFDLIPFFDQVNFLIGGELLTQHRAHLHAALEVQD
jgi:hypothetical protein